MNSQISLREFPPPSSVKDIALSRTHVRLRHGDGRSGVLRVGRGGAKAFAVTTGVTASEASALFDKVLGRRSGGITASKPEQWVSA